MKLCPLALLVALTMIVASIDVAGAQPAPIPADYSGTVTIGGAPAPNGATVQARIDTYTSSPVTVTAGRYSFLIVRPPSSTFQGKTVIFLVNGQAAKETSVFEQGSSKTVNLTVTTALATATATVAPRAFYYGTITIGGAPAPNGTTVQARIATYTSAPVTTSGGRYQFLVVSPPSSSYQGRTITFLVGGVEANETSVFEQDISKLLNLTVGTPLATPTATAAPLAAPTAAPPAPWTFRSYLPLAIKGSEMEW